MPPRPNAPPQCASPIHGLRRLPFGRSLTPARAGGFGPCHTPHCSPRCTGCRPSNSRSIGVRVMSKPLNDPNAGAPRRLMFHDSSAPGQSRGDRSRHRYSADPAPRSAPADRSRGAHHSFHSTSSLVNSASGSARGFTASNPFQLVTEDREHHPQGCARLLPSLLPSLMVMPETLTHPTDESANTCSTRGKHRPALPASIFEVQSTSPTYFSRVAKTAKRGVRGGR